MKKALLPFLLLAIVTGWVSAQTVILDFETPETSTTFQYFGSSLDPTLNQVVDNPDASGENTSALVGEFIKPAGAEVWAGAFSNPDPATLLDMSANNRISIKVYMPHPGNLSIKLEQSPDGGDNWIQTVTNTRVNEWETLVFDVAQPSLEAPFTAAAGHVYARLVLFFDFGSNGTDEDVVYYFDDVVTLPPAPTIVNILDFETPETSTTFQYFGSPIDGSFNQIVENPLPDGINTSAMVAEFIKPDVAEVWAGAFSNPNPSQLITLDPGSQICIKVLMDHPGNLALKLEQGTGGQPNWVTIVENDTPGEWTELCFDPTSPSVEAPFEPASGSFERVVLFFDFGTGGTGEVVTSYFDDLVVKTTAAPQARTIHFRVDMNNYTGNFDQVYLSGSFNDWSGTANPLSDPEFDGIWEGTLELFNGAYEFKVTLDDWAAQEEFYGIEECTRRDLSGQFVNRLLLVSGDADLPEFAFNSCYDFGDEVLLTFRLGFGSTEPSPDGVWLAGGGNFGDPGSDYRMVYQDEGYYEITVPRRRGFSGYYTFTNGNCPDYSCKEDISGQDCANPENFNDRFLNAAMDNVTIATCYGQCTQDLLCEVGIDRPQHDAGVFELYGNPAFNGTAVIAFGDATGPDKIIHLSDALGRIVGQWRVQDDMPFYTLSLQDLSRGIYYVTVTSAHRYYTRKLIH